MRGIAFKFIAASSLLLALTAAPFSASAADTASNARPLITQSIDETKLVELSATVRPEIKMAQDQGIVASSMPMPKMQLLLKRTPEQQQALETVLTQIGTPGSSMYHQLLTPADYSETFGLAASDLAAIQQWLEFHGFRISSVDNGKLAITFNGTAGQVEEAFHTEIHTYKTPDVQVHYANANAVQVPAAFANVVAGLSGLQNFSVMHDANYEGNVALPDFANVKVAAAAPTIVGLGRSVESQVNEEGIFPSSGNILTYLQDGSEGTPKAGLATSTSVSLTPNTVTYAAVSNVAIQAVLSWSGSGTPTGSVSFYDTENDLYEQILLTSCTLNAGASTYTCTFNWNGAGAVPASPDAITAYYLGDSTYAASSSTANLTITYPHPSGQFTNVFSAFTDTPGDQNYGVSTPQTINVSTVGFFVTAPPTGNILVTGNGGINEITNISPLDNVFCIFIICYSSSSIGWNPYAYLQPGVYTLTATYSGDGNYAANNATTTFTVNGTGTQANTTVLTANPNVVTSTALGTTFTTVTTWTGGGAAPTGQVSISAPNGTGLGGAVFPISGATSSGGGGTYNGGAGSYSFNCATNSAAKTITCTVVDSDVYDPLPNVGANTVTATYGGNSVYARSSGTTTVYKSQNNTSSLTVAGNPSQGIYGEGTSITYTASVVGGRNLAAPTGSVTFTGITITGSPLSGTLGNCSFVNHTYTCTASVTAIIPYLTAPNNYAVNASYPGDAVYAGSSNTVTETVVKQTPTLSAPTLTPNAEPTGSTGPVAMSTTFTWVGSGLAPTGAVTFLVGTTTVGTGTCAGSGDTETCTYSYNPSALSAGTYAVTAHYAGDGNYNAVTSTSSTLTISGPAQTPTLTLTSNNYGTTTAGVPTGTQIKLTATLTVPTYNGAWSGTVTFIDATTGYTIGTANVTGTSATTTATITFTPTATAPSPSEYPAGYNQFTATYSGNSIYKGVGPVNAAPVYLAGVLYSLTLNHNFSVNPGTYDGSPVGGCAGGVTTTTCTEPYYIQLYNFTTTAQAATLTFTNAASGAFSYSTNCPASLAAGATCSYAFQYLPPQGDGCVLNSTTCTQGTYEAGSWKIVTAANSGVGQPSFPAPVRSGPTTFPAILSGKALLPSGSMMVSPLSYTFPTIATGATSNTLTIIVTNPNTSPVPFTYTGPAAPFSATNTCKSPLQGGTSCNIYVLVGSTTPGTYSSSVVLAPGNAPAITSAFSVTIQANNGLTLNSNYHNFGNVTLNTSSVFGLSITNNSGATQAIGVNYNIAQGYSVVNGCGTALAAGSACAVSVTFSPSATGTFTDAVTISSAVPIVPGGTGTSGNYSAVVNFTGNGVAGGQFTATSVRHNWGDIAVGTSGGNYGVELSNNTTAAITLSTGPLSSTLTGFSLVASSCGTSLAVNASCELIFTFTPNAAGSVSATYPITSSSPLYSGGVVVSPSQITLSGTGQ